MQTVYFSLKANEPQEIKLPTLFRVSDSEMAIFYQVHNGFVEGMYDVKFSDGYTLAKSFEIVIPSVILFKEYDDYRSVINNIPFNSFSLTAKQDMEGYINLTTGISKEEMIEKRKKFIYDGGIYEVTKNKNLTNSL